MRTEVEKALKNMGFVPGSDEEINLMRFSGDPNLFVMFQNISSTNPPHDCMLVTFAMQREGDKIYDPNTFEQKSPFTVLHAKCIRTKEHVASFVDYVLKYDAVLHWLRENKIKRITQSES